MATEQQGALLWEPDEERIERAAMTRYMRWLDEERGLRFDDYAALWEWSTTELEDFWASLWEYFDVQASYDEVLADRSMPGAKWFTGAELSYPEHIFRDRPATAWRSATPPSCATPASGRGTSCAPRPRACAPACRPWASSAATASSPTCRTSPRRSPPSSRSPASARCGRAARPTSARARVVDRFAQIEPKVLLCVDGYRYGGKDYDRRELIEKRPGRDALARAHGDARLPRPGQERLGRGVPGDRRGARVRPRAVRPPAVGPLLVGHHRPAEGDRALAGRDPARAPQEAPPPPRRPGRRPPVLVHDDGLDDVELPASVRCSPTRRSCSTTATRARRTWACCGTSPSRPG